jgi:hypothetical protein
MVSIWGYCDLSGEAIVGQKQPSFQGGNTKKLPESEEIEGPAYKLWKMRGKSKPSPHEYRLMERVDASYGLTRIS